MGIYKGKIKHIHFEPTSECNARCPQCPRTYFHSLKTHPLLKVEHWTVDQVKDVLSDDLFSQVETVLINGNFGDIAMHPEAKKIIQCFLNKGMFVEVHTNGGVQTKNFWSWLGQQSNVVTMFGIDGLADTHHLYRRNTTYERVLRNARYYIDSGGDAHWRMTLFNHNSHQVEECRKIAKNTGFSHFLVRPSTRSPNLKLSCVDREFEHLYYLEACEGSENHNEKSISRETYVSGEKDYHQTYGRSKKTQSSGSAFLIDCRVSDSSSVFLSYDKRIFPCCWTASSYELHTTGRAYSSFSDIMGFGALSDSKFNCIVSQSPSMAWKKVKAFQAIQNSWDTSAPCTSCFFACTKASKYGKQSDETLEVRF